MVYTVFIIVVSVVPLPQEDVEQPIPLILYNVSLGHIVLYVIAGILWYRALDVSYRLALAYTIVTPLTETVQLLVPYRYPCINDLFSNIIGLAIATIVIYVYRVYKK